MAQQTPDTSTPDSLRLTYAALAHRLGISGGAVRVLVRRRGWFRVMPNRKGGETIVVVPAEDLAAEEQSRIPGAPLTSGDKGNRAVAHTSGGLAQIVRAFEQATTTFIALQTEANKRVEAAERRAEAAEERLRKVEREAEARARDAEARLADLSGSDAARRARAPLARAWRALRGTD